MLAPELVRLPVLVLHPASAQELVQELVQELLLELVLVLAPQPSYSRLQR